MDTGICFDQNNYHDSLQECLTEGIAHYLAFCVFKLILKLMDNGI